ncbi:alpha/beta hydrolase family protein [Sphingomonas baiyangensis]|uniref:S9 family peptidase n=1 Tax=Sphingomonas baiyangensis TaxID=2572576 RepID=A0A4U1L5N8_9SPHN|nr:S9 family peptidase [Sphingomonas baiyangensis]TKD52249.1 S9 family peptidase [Sphingomonas baiyangensis]
MFRTTVAALLCAAALPIAAPIAFAQQMEAPDRRFTGADLFGLEQAADPQISPDGSRVAYVRRSGDVMTDRMRSAIWLVDVRTGQQSPLAATPGSHLSPRWSPDGSRLTYVSAVEGQSPQLHVRWMASGETARITGLPDSPSAVAWSPDGRQIAYVMRVPGEPMKLGEAPKKPEGAKWAEPLEIIDRVTYRADGAGYLKPGFDHVFVVSADGGAPRQVTFGKFNHGGPLSWSRDGRTLVLSANRRPDWEREPNDSDVYAVDIASGSLTKLTSRYGPDEAPVLSPDGSKIAYLGFDDKYVSYTPSQLYVMDRDGSNVRPLTADLDRGIDTVEWADDGRSLYVSYDDDARKKVARIGLDGRRTVLHENLAGGGLDRPYTGGAFSVSDGGTIAYTGDASGGMRPADLFVGGRQVTRLNDTLMAAKTMGRVEPLDVTAKDGRKIASWLVLPPGHQPGTRVPLILEIHGGPHTAYGPVFATDNQLYAAAGYAVLYTNPRGSTSYGSEFANLIDKNYPSEDYDDLIAAVDAAIAAGVADPDNLFVTGGSGGGVLTSWIVGKTDRFKAAATQKPVINWISEALTMDGTGFTSRYWFAKQPWEDPMSYWNRSPLSLVGNVKTPTLVVVGAEDYRTPVSESEQYYAALQIRGVPTALVKVPGASHGGFTARPSQSAAKAAAILAWFDRYRTDRARPAAPAIASAPR